MHRKMEWENPQTAPAVILEISEKYLENIQAALPPKAQETSKVWPQEIRLHPHQCVRHRSLLHEWLPNRKKTSVLLIPGHPFFFGCLNALPPSLEKRVTERAFFPGLEGHRDAPLKALRFGPNDQIAQTGEKEDGQKPRQW